MTLFHKLGIGLIDTFLDKMKLALCLLVFLPLVYSATIKEEEKRFFFEGLDLNGKCL